MLTTNKGIAIALLAGLSLFSCTSKQPEPRQEVRLTPSAHSRTEKASAPGTDKSPMDMSYYPTDFPIQRMSGKVIFPPVARVIYSRPSKDGRSIFGALVKYGQHWRLGANEATEIEFFIPVKINGQPIKKGRYVIYCIPFKDKWNIILNEDLFTWGLKINASKDVYSFTIPVEVVPQVREVFTMEFEKAKQGILLTMAWDNVQASLPIAI